MRWTARSTGPSRRTRAKWRRKFRSGRSRSVWATAVAGAPRRYSFAPLVHTSSNSRFYLSNCFGKFVHTKFDLFFIRGILQFIQYYTVLFYFSVVSLLRRRARRAQQANRRQRRPSDTTTPVDEQMLKNSPALE